jgi:hypothetical protein
MNYDQNAADAIRGLLELRERCEQLETETAGLRARVEAMLHEEAESDKSIDGRSAVGRIMGRFRALVSGGGGECDKCGGAGTTDMRHRDESKCEACSGTGRAGNERAP